MTMTWVHFRVSLGESSALAWVEIDLSCEANKHHFYTKIGRYVSDLVNLNGGKGGFADEPASVIEKGSGVRELETVGLFGFLTERSTSRVTLRYTLNLVKLKRNRGL